MHTYNLGTKLLIVINTPELSQETYQQLLAGFFVHVVKSPYRDHDPEPTLYDPSIQLALVIDELNLYNGEELDHLTMYDILDAISTTLPINCFVHHEPDGTEWTYLEDPRDVTAHWLSYDPTSNREYHTSHDTVGTPREPKPAADS